MALPFVKVSQKPYNTHNNMYKKTGNYSYLIRKIGGTFLICEAKTTPLLQAECKHYNKELEHKL